MGAGIVIAALIVAAMIVDARALHGKNRPGRTDPMRAVIARDVDSLDAALVALRAALSTRDSSTARRVRAAFRRSRARYKRLEGIAEFYAPALAASLNSRRQEVDDDDAPPPSTIAPGGFPALELLVWPAIAPGATSDALRLVDGMRKPVARLRALATEVVPTDAQIIELARLELARVSTLGIAGFDTPRTRDAMREGAEALDGVRALYAAVGAQRWPALARERRALDSTWARATGYLRAHPGFDTFDRLEFVAFVAEPAARALDALRRAARTVPIGMPRGWRADVPSVYGAAAFDSRAYAPRTAPRTSPGLVALGRRLFFDPALSGTGKRSCASCHDPARAFADGLPRAASLGPNGGLVARNTPTLINAALQPAQFADERAVTLEDQVLEVLRSPAEMASSVERVATALGRDDGYVREFLHAFGPDTTPAVTPLRVRFALAAFVRSLVSLESRFDRAVRGDTAAMTAEEHRGFTLFMGKAACGTCHFAPLFSGNTPPLYMSSDVEVIGTSTSPATPSRLDQDSGRAAIDHRPEHVRAFKTPSLRNVALTAPYMHNGAFRTLDDVLRFYDAGGGRGAGARIANQTLAADSLHLSAGERAAIAAFLRTLSDASSSTEPAAPP